MKVYLGIDVGSVSTNFVVIDKNNQVIEELYLRTQGKPLEIIKQGFIEIYKNSHITVEGVGTTGSGRQLASLIVGADIVKNEITAHAVAAASQVSDVRTVLEIGGQDSKIIILDNGIVSDFAMNTVCAAGTGSFLDQQAARLGLSIEEFGRLALEGENPVRIAGRCSVFAESDMIHKQQLGHSLPDIIAGLSQALVRNYLNNVGKGKKIESSIVFQGGVAANPGIKKAFEEALDTQVIIPKYYSVMGALGAAILAKEAVEEKGSTNYKGRNLLKGDYKTTSFECNGCANLCEVVELYFENDLQARWGDKCNKWTDSLKTVV